jgi:hypothetical protein
VIRLVVMLVNYPLSLRNVEDLLAERGIDICHETVRFWWTRFGPIFACYIRRERVDRMRRHTDWKWRLGEVYVKINGSPRELARAGNGPLAGAQPMSAHRAKLPFRTSSIMSRMGGQESLGESAGLKQFAGSDPASALRNVEKSLFQQGIEERR